MFLSNSHFQDRLDFSMQISIRFPLLVALAVIMGGCAAPPYTSQTTTKPISPPIDTPATAAPTMPTQPAAPPPVATPAEPSLSEKNLAVALASFDRGEYPLAMKQLKPLTTDQDLSTADRLKAIKSLAFSQCLTRAVVACRKTFESAFELDPEFNLAPAEQGHPVWGPQFLRARSSKAKSK